MTRVHIPPDHPAFAGHFPGAPVLPGVVLLAHVLRAAEAEAAPEGAGWQIDQVKFLGPVGPGSDLCIELAPRGAAVGFEVRHGARLVASGRLSRLDRG